VQGTGTLTHWLSDGLFSQSNFITYIRNDYVFGYGETTCLVKNGVHINIGGSVATDLNYLYGCDFAIR
jgi:hypothetical protein